MRQPATPTSTGRSGGRGRKRSILHYLFFVDFHCADCVVDGTCKALEKEASALLWTDPPKIPWSLSRYLKVYGPSALHRRAFVEKFTDRIFESYYPADRSIQAQAQVEVREALRVMGSWVSKRGRKGRTSEEALVGLCQAAAEYLERKAAHAGGRGQPRFDYRRHRRELADEYGVSEDALIDEITLARRLQNQLRLGTRLEAVDLYVHHIGQAIRANTARGVAPPILLARKIKR